MSMSVPITTKANINKTKPCKAIEGTVEERTANGLVVNMLLSPLNIILNIAHNLNKILVQLTNNPI